LSYAQINYPQIQGINGRYTVHDIGCFLTAFANLELDYGKYFSPLDINNSLRDRNLFIDVDDGIRDDVDWGFITYIDPETSVDHFGSTGWPDSNQAIVKFKYVSGQTHKLTTHFCKVQDFRNQTILDSWDGVVKHVNGTIYGQPVGWAVYKRGTVNPITAYTPWSDEQLTPQKTLTNKQPTSWWSLTNTTTDINSFHPATVLQEDTPFDVGGYAHHINGYIYAMTPDDFARVVRGDFSTNNGVNIKDLKEVPAPVVVTPATPPAGPVNIPLADKYKLVTKVMYFKDANAAANLTTPVGFLEKGSYYVFPDKQGMKHLSSDNHTDDGYWINPKQNVVQVEVPKPAPVQVPEKITETIKEAAAQIPVHELTKDEWKATISSLNLDRSPEYFTSLNNVDMAIPDLDNKGEAKTLAAYTQHIPIVATIEKDNILYGLPAKSISIHRYYAIPMYYLEAERGNVFDTYKSFEEKVVTNTVRLKDYIQEAYYRVQKHFVDGIKNTKPGKDNK
jgi:hypothetical protein